ncbi:MAG: rRNA maturation RNase YbeY [Mediterraneibacter gnavus]
MLGDIVISIEKVFAQAESLRTFTASGICISIAHSMLHLFGYDHMEEVDEMI